MSEKLMKKHLEEKVNDWIYKSNFDPALLGSIKSSGYVAGGAIASLLRNEEPNDYDIYLGDPIVAENLLSFYVRKYNSNPANLSRIRETEENGKTKYDIPWEGKKNSLKDDEKGYKVKYITPTAVSLTDDIQIITKYTGDPNSVIGKFDFSHAKSWYSIADNNLHITEEATKAILFNELKYTGSDYPLASFVRARKFIKRGWNISAGEILKIAFDAHELDLTDPDILREQLNGIDIIIFNDIIRDIESDIELDDSLMITPDYIANLVDRYF